MYDRFPLIDVPLSAVSYERGTPVNRDIAKLFKPLLGTNFDPFDVVAAVLLLFFYTYIHTHTHTHIYIYIGRA